MTAGAARKRSLRERLDLTALNPGSRPIIFSIALGALCVFGFAPFYWFPIPVLCLAALAWLWNRCHSAGQALCLGFGFGLGYFLAGVSWVYVSLHDFGGMPLPLACFATAFFCSYLALYPAATGWMVKRFAMSRSIVLGLLFPAAWTFTEWVRGWMFTGFPWIGVGYSQSPTGPLSGFAALFGVYGVAFVTVSSAGLLCWLAEIATLGTFRQTPEGSGQQPAMPEQVRGVRALAKQPALYLLILLWIAGWGLQHVAWTTPMAESLAVSLVQGNVKQDLKWRPEWVQASLDLYLDLTRKTRGRLIVLPETAVPLVNIDVPPAFFDALAQHARRQQGDLLVGVPEYVQGTPPRYYNAVMSLGTNPVQHYQKYHLVPFGDYFPHWVFLSWIMNALEIPMSDFSRGDAYQQPMNVAGQRVAVNICYEDAFGEEIIHQLPQATLLANFTNDAWWGESIAAQQHLQISQMRAQETGRYMLRAT
ncbi:MAG: apolipoprotein N-acyltransferase, partial [Betaproteobacteria bacterium]